jgi:rhamnogalacturonyl hydrolase YesR
VKFKHPLGGKGEEEWGEEMWEEDQERWGRGNGWLECKQIK